MPLKNFGSAVALVTPFDTRGALDTRALKKLVNWHIEQGTNALVPVGTTGEAATLSLEEHRTVIELVVKETAGRIPVIAGTGSNNTEEAIELTRAAETLGADAGLLITPYYNKPTQEGLYQHLKAIHDATRIPLILYDVPSRTVTRLENSTIARMAKDLTRVVGVKDATADLARPIDLTALCGGDFIQISGDDATTLPYLLMGGHGAISVTANIAPRLCADVYRLAVSGAWTEALEVTRRLMPLHQKLFITTSPLAVKYALSRMGLCENVLRLPLTPLPVEYQGVIDSVLRDLGVLS
jgi:4-hydroxy-tetrahydrodipicolinate synthase